MRMALISTLSSLGLLGGCATAGMGHGMGGMNHEEMMRQCQMMQQSPDGQPGAQQGTMHGAMSHEEMMRHCEMMRQNQGAPAQPPAADPHQH